MSDADVHGVDLLSAMRQEELKQISAHANGLDIDRGQR